MLTQTEFKKRLKANSACRDGYNFAKGMSLPEFWQKCKRPDWMIWVIRKMPECFPTVEKSTWVAVAIKSAESVLHLAEGLPNAHSAATKAIEAAKAWLNNPTEESRQAAAYAARAAADAASAYAAYAAYAAACASRADSDATAYAARAAAYAAACAADAGIESVADYIRQTVIVVDSMHKGDK